MSFITQKSISFVIPLYNEEENVRKIIRDIETMALRLAANWEMIVVESGSIDNTWKELQKLTQSMKNVYIFHQKAREGMGSALRLAYSKSTKDIICHIEGDSPFDFRYFNIAIPLLDEFPCVIGFRINSKGINKHWRYHNMSKMNTFIRFIYHVGYNLLLRMIFNLRVRDVNFSFKLFRRNLLDDIHLFSSGWFIDAELLLEFKKQNIIPLEIPILYQDRCVGKSSVNFFSPCHILLEMFNYWKLH